VRSLDWDGYIRLAFDEIRLAAGGYPQATRRLRAAFDDLKAAAPPDRQAPLDRQLRLLEQAVRRDLQSRDDIDAALIPGQQGIGSGTDVAPNGLLSAQRQRDQPGRNYPFGGYGRSPFRQIWSRCEVPAVTGRSHPGQHQRLRPQAVRRAGSSLRLIA
jgi:hypothetical protein